MKSWMSKNIKTADLSSDKDDSLIYTASDVVKYYQYKLSNGSLENSYAYVKSGYSSELVDFLLERYVSVTVEDDYVGMISPEKDMLIIVMTVKVNGSYYYQVGYWAYEPSSTRVANEKISTMAEEMQKESKNHGMTTERIPLPMKARLGVAE